VLPAATVLVLLVLVIVSRVAGPKLVSTAAVLLAGFVSLVPAVVAMVKVLVTVLADA
jgi:hypothetical protein